MPWTILVTVGGLWTLAVVVPGPNFLVTARAAAARGRGAGLRTANGVACGTALWGLAGAFGVSALFAAAPWLYLGLKVGGGFYICWLGLGLLRRTGSPMDGGVETGKGRFFQSGLLTSLSNPKTAAFVASLFALSFPREASLLLGVSAAGVMTGISILWYGTMAMILGGTSAARAYARARTWIDRIAGGLFIALGLRLAISREG
ncbi:MAG: LysE family transporter [Rhodospirillum sp.]|nr:LysE family transporter [Rhodospirillum sp.]MCF8490911.1 LysE family transporter [Rhodospirillum sp.]MCF8499086.1 LysE family transporter [Rhodospirillum sp.]